MPVVRQPAVAGMFYPADPEQLQFEIEEYLDRASPTGDRPKALIVPHAGYPYSGPIAASGYARLQDHARTIDRVVLIGPAHRHTFRGMAASAADQFATPLGPVPLDRDEIDRLLRLPQVCLMDTAHEAEHSLEVHVPFLQVVLDRFSLIPLAAGRADVEEVAEVLEWLWGGDETLIVVSSDLSHYHDYRTASRLDEATSACIEALDFEDLTPERACGYCGIRGLLSVARERGMRVTTVDLRNSGDTAGPQDQVVGYGAYVVS